MAAVKSNPDLQRAEESGVLAFERDTVGYTSRYYGSFSIPVADIAVIGEYTNQDGPYLDDWFLDFVLRDGCTIFRASAYAVNCREVLDLLSRVLGASLPRRLTSTDFDSRVMWPPNLAGQPLYEFSRIRDDNANFWRRVIQRIFPRITIKLSEAVIQYIASSH